jgi:hypothetical protein
VSFLALTLGVLGVWRVTHLLHAEEGPWEMVIRLRRLMGTSILGRAMDCFDCLSLWVAAPCAWLVGPTWLDRALWWPALSAGAMVLHRVVSRLEPPRAAVYEEDLPEEPRDVQLRTEAGDPLHTH